ncbi:MAG: diguanylate cyclase [Anaerolineales bacterium]|nr:diguanylate cyclase [Anaerolineales bacterium]
MQFVITAHAVILFLTTILSLIITLLSIKRVATHGARLFTMILAFITLYAMANMLESAVLGIPEKNLFAKIAYIGFYGAATLLLIFALNYTQRGGWLEKGGWILLWVLPVIMILIAWTNELHHLLWIGFTYQEGPLNLLVYHHGVLYYAGMTVVYGYTFVAMALMIQKALKASAVQRRDLSFFIFGTLIPVIGGGIYMLDLDFLQGLDITPICFLATAGIMLYPISQDQILNLIPVARTRLIEDMNDGVLVLDTNGIIVDQNPASSSFPGIRSGVIGTPASEVFSAYPEVLYALQMKENTLVELFPSEGDMQAVEVRIKVMQNKSGRLTGFLLNLHDFTNRYQAHLKLAEANETLKVHLVEIELLQVKLKDQAVRDPLTGLFNRRYLEETLPREIARSIRNHIPLTITMIDIDHFKDLNDSYGHGAGDLFLQEIGSLYNKHIRQEDFACRYGGEEFLLVFPGLPLEIAVRRVEDLRKIFEDWEVSYENKLLKRTFSAGIAVCPEHGISSDELIRAADSALYKGKAKGRNSVQMAG